VSIDVQRFRDASMSYMGLCDAFLFTPGWRESEGCRAEMEACNYSERLYVEVRERSPEALRVACGNMRLEDGQYQLQTLEEWIAEMAAALGRPPRVYVAGPYLTGVDGPYDEKLFHGSLLLALSCDLNTPHAIDTNAWHLARNIRNGLDWCRRVMDAGGYPYCPWADALLVIAPPSEEVPA